MIVVGDQLLGLHRDDVIIAINDLHTHNPELKLPVVFSGTEDVATGGLMCYGPEHERLFKRVGPIIHQVCAKLNGSDPTPLTSIDYIRPSLEDMRVVVNFGTAKGHGVKIPDLTLLSTF